jgi:hypothetical protein
VSVGFQFSSGAGTREGSRVCDAGSIVPERSLRLCQSCVLDAQFRGKAWAGLAGSDGIPQRKMPCRSSC